MSTEPEPRQPSQAGHYVVAAAIILAAVLLILFLHRDSGCCCCCQRAAPPAASVTTLGEHQVLIPPALPWAPAAARGEPLTPPPVLAIAAAPMPLQGTITPASFTPTSINVVVPPLDAAPAVETAPLPYVALVGGGWSEPPRVQVDEAGGSLAWLAAGAAMSWAMARRRREER